MRFIWCFYFVYLTEKETESTQECTGRGGGAEGQGEGDSLLRREPHMGLDPGMPGSSAEPKADT